jgi:hypothetical protein
MIAHLTPDLPRKLTVGDARKLYLRPSFRVGARTFVKVDAEDDTYSDGKITVYHDQQDSSSWAARAGSLNTGYFWTPEWAVEAVLESLEAATCG